MPSTALTASKRRPALVDFTVFILFPSMKSMLCLPFSSPSPSVSPMRFAASLPSAVLIMEYAIRHPSLEATSPPACINGAILPTRSYPLSSPSRNSPPQIVPSGPYPVPSKVTPRAVPSYSFSAMHDTMCA